METFFGQPSSWLSLLGSMGVILAGHIANKYVIPFLKIGRRKDYAEYIAKIADEITDDLKKKYPDKQWLTHVDAAVDSLIAICGISPQIARRAINAAITRKS